MDLPPIPQMTDHTMRGLACLVQTATALGVKMDAPDWIYETIQQAKKVVAERDAAKDALREARRGLAWVSLPNMPEATKIIKQIDRCL